MAMGMGMYSLCTTVTCHLLARSRCSASMWVLRPLPILPLQHHHLATLTHTTSLLTRALPKYAAGFCDATAALKYEKEDHLKGLSKGSVEPVVKSVLVQAQKAASGREIFHSDFLTPPVLEDALLAIKKLSDVEALVQGGYPQAERCRLSIGNPDVLSSASDAVAVLSISGNFTFDPASHGDFLGAVLATGIRREKFGDILLQGEKGAQIIVVPELVDYVVSSLTQVRNVPVSCSPIPLLALEFQPPRTKVLKSVEASLRVDAIASAGFQMSRSKLVNLISSGDVRVNWSEVTKNGTLLKTGDIISIKGKGRVQVGEIKTTRKGKFAIDLIRYV